jgi:hypothetical protein
MPSFSLILCVIVEILTILEQFYKFLVHFLLTWSALVKLLPHYFDKKDFWVKIFNKKKFWFSLKYKKIICAFKKNFLRGAVFYFILFYLSFLFFHEILFHPTFLNFFLKNFEKWIAVGSLGSDSVSINRSVGSARKFFYGHQGYLQFFFLF